MADEPTTLSHASRDPSPYARLVDSDELAQLEQAIPGSGMRVFDLIARDMEVMAERLTVQDAREYSLRLLATWLTMVVVLTLAALSAWVIIVGSPVAGSILATVDLVAIANVFINSWKRT